MSTLRALALALLVFPMGLATHEVMHLAVYSALGYGSALVVTQWSVGVGGAHIFGLHAAPAVGVTVPLRALVLNNFLGPTLAATLMFTLFLAVRGQAARGALLANSLVLLFFAGIETAYPLLEDVVRVNADVLLLPALNYGAALLILAAASGAVTLSGGRPSTPARRPTGGTARLPAP
jgi:hypothetical protein